jgi:hypothetical protein
MDKKKNSHKYLGNSWPEVRTAPDPELIIWGNLGVSRCEQFGRSFLVFILQTAVTIASFLLILYVIQYQDNKNKEIWTSDSCGNHMITNSKAREYLLQKDKIKDVWCYCKQEFNI